MKTVLSVLLDDFADWEGAFLAPALRSGVAASYGFNKHGFCNE